MTPYIVLCPAAYGALRSAPYSLWLNLAAALADKFVVVLVGRTTDQGQLPMPDMTFGEFYQQIDAMAKKNPKRIFNLIGPTPLRPMMALVARATALVSLDSGMLYVAQASRVPAVSMWGTHAPHARLLYDAPYMRGAIWNRQACPCSPCWAYAGFPESKCPQGASQRACAPIASVTVDDVMKKLDVVLTDVDGARPALPLSPSDAIKVVPDTPNP
jgi:ADP-heptose:LPS heptosyltransferase